MLKMYLYWDLSYFHLGGFQSISISGEFKGKNIFKRLWKKRLPKSKDSQIKCDS